MKNLWTFVAVLIMAMAILEASAIIAFLSLFIYCYGAAIGKGAE